MWRSLATRPPTLIDAEIAPNAAIIAISTTTVSARLWVARSTVASVARIAVQKSGGRDVHRDRRLVEHQQPRIAGEGGGEPHPLLLSPREPSVPLGGDVGDPGPTQYVVDRQRSREQRGDQPHDLARGDVVGQAAV